LGWIGKVLGGGIVAPIAGTVTQWQNHRAEIKQQEHELKMSVLKNKARLAESQQTHNSNKEMRQLEVASPWMRRIVASHVLVLIDVAVINPTYANKIFASLNNVPTWVIGLYVTVFGFYLAKEQLSDYGAGLVQTWRKPKEKTSEVHS